MFIPQHTIEAEAVVGVAVGEEAGYKHTKSIVIEYLFRLCRKRWYTRISRIQFPVLQNHTHIPQMVFQFIKLRSQITCFGNCILIQSKTISSMMFITTNSCKPAMTLRAIHKPLIATMPQISKICSCRTQKNLPSMRSEFRRFL